jgi:hypothetical protein
MATHESMENEFFQFEYNFAILRRAALECLARASDDNQILDSPAGFFRFAEIHALKEEIVRTGKKLWDRA